MAYEKSGEVFLLRIPTDSGPLVDALLRQRIQYITDNVFLQSVRGGQQMPRKR